MTEHFVNSDPGSSTTDCLKCGGAAAPDHQAWNRRARGETPLQRVDRGYLELLQEVRVAQTGVQIVLAFLLWLAYSPNFTRLGAVWRWLYVAGLVCGLAAAACLIAPVCCHRLIYGRGLKPQLFTVANRLTVCGLGCLLGAVGCVLALVVGPIAGGPVGGAISAIVLILFGSIWYVIPVILRSQHTRLCPDCT
jgi:hypothetical protein